MNMPMDRDADALGARLRGPEGQRRHLRHRRADRADRARSPAGSPGRCERGRVNGSLLLAPTRDAAHPGARPVAGDAVSVRRLARVAFAVIAAVAAVASEAAAHPAPFSFLDLRIDDGRIAGTLTVHDLDAAHELGLADAGALLDPATAQPARRRAGRPPRPPAAADRRRPAASVTLSDVTPLPDRQALRFTLARAARPAGPARRIDATLFPYDRQHQTFVNVYEDGALRHQAILDARRTAMDYYAGTLARRRGGAGDVRAGRASTTSRSARTTSCSWSACSSSADRSAASA